MTFPEAARGNQKLPPLGWRAKRWLGTRAAAEALDAFKRSCELTFTERGIHGTGKMEVSRYPFSRSDFAGVWVTYSVTIKKGEPMLTYAYDEDEPKRKRLDRTFTDPRGNRVGIVNLDTAQEFMMEMSGNLSPYHEGQPARWTAYGYGTTTRGKLKEIGEKQLSSTKSLPDATGQALAYIDDWLQGVVYSSSDMGTVHRLWLAARLF